MDEIHCPLCCNNTFSSQQALVKHLMYVLDNIRCPLCHNQLASIASLIEHISLSNCQEQNSFQTIVFIEDEDFRETHDVSHCNPKMPCVENQNGDVDMPTERGTDVNNDMGDIYVELLKKDSMSEPLQENHDLKLREDEDGQFVLVSHEDTSSGTTIVTKQNRDGTISVTTENVNSNPKMLPDERPEQTYSCNTCGVTFSSVLEHIQNYHNDQDVVVEDHFEETDESIPIEYSNSEDSLDKAQRVVLDAGTGMETPMLKVEPLSKQVAVPVSVVDSQAVGKSKKVDEVVNKQVPLRRYALIEKFCDSYVMEIKRSNDDKNRPFHNIVMKEMQALDNGNKVKVFNCISCNLYVTDLDDFKDKPCNARYPCTHCSVVYDNVKSLTAHMNVHKGDTARYPCPHCSVVYDNSKSLSAHMKVHRGDTARYPCPQCSIVYDNAKSLSAHMKVHKGDTAPFACEICGTVFGTNKSLKLHKRMHDPIKPRPIEPPVQSEHSEDISLDNFVCTICDKVIPLDYRSVHERSHSDEETFNCDVCNRKFTTFEFLEMHLKVHNMDKAPANKQDKKLPYSCSYCSRQFSRPHEKVKHERIHTGEKPHSCEICGKSFRVSYCLTLHMRTHTGARPYECNHCGKKFKAHSVYNHHLLTHSEVRAYKCPYCPKAFKTSVQLAGHKNSHTKPFACQYCNRPFASLYAVRVHTETHQRQNNLKFACELCGATYARTFALKDHMRQAHQKELQTVDPLVSTQKIEKQEDWATPQEPEEERIHILKDFLAEDKSQK